jgi:hypothetical protein
MEPGWNVATSVGTIGKFVGLGVKEIVGDVVG